MVIRISSGSSPTGAVYYNENKVGKGEAERLAVRNFRGVGLPVEELGLPTVAAKLERQAALNPDIKKPTFHASLSLAHGEKPSVTAMLAIADRYMQGLGYGGQPYVVYQHHDTDHAHLHIVSVRVNNAGRKVPDNYERERSNKLRQDIEIEFGLQVAEKAALRPERKELSPVEYGKGDLKRDISAVVNGVLKDFTFSSFSQFNQLLFIHNVKATEVPLEGRKPGLVYSAIDKDNVSLGATFKSSTLPQQPTMETVTRRMNAGKKVKGDRVARLRAMVEPQLSQSKTWDDFQQRLSRAGVEVIPHQGKDGNLFGLSFVDVRERTIYTGSELGKAFTAGSLKNQLGAYQQRAPFTLQKPENQDHSTSIPDEKLQINPNQPLSAAEPLNYEYAEDSNEAVRRRMESEAFARANPFRRPTAEEKIEHKISSKEWAKQNADEWKKDHQQDKGQEPVHNIDLVARLLYALNGDETGQENEHELKKMLKRARKPRL